MWRSPKLENIPDLLLAQAERYGPKVCMFFEDVPVTYEEMELRSNAVANQLQALGVGHGDTVAMLMENNPEVVYTWFGAAKLGAVEVPINVDYKGEYLRHQLDNCGAGVVVVDAARYERVSEVLDSLPQVRAVVVRGGMTEDTLGSAARAVPRRVRLEPYDFLLGGGPERPTVVRKPSGEDPCAIIYTAGTTGPSKGAVMSHHYLVRGMATTFAEGWDQGPDDVIYSPLPLFHGNAQTVTVLASILCGGTGVLDRRFSVSRTWDRVRQYQATGICILGSMIVMLWNLPEDERDAALPCRVLIGAPVPKEIHRGIEERYGLRICMFYGLTEAAPLIIGGLDQELTPGASGRVNPRYEVRVFDDEDREVPVGEAGEVVCRPLEPQVMFSGYYRNAEATLAQFRDLWFHTGDLGRFDADGNFYFVDRKKDAMRRRGENISSFEVERAVMIHPGVAECAAHAVASDFSEDDVMICVVLKPGVELTAQELMDHCVANMPYFAVPRYVEFFSELPKNPVGRVLKYELRRRGVTDGTWDREAAGYQVVR